MHVTVHAISTPEGDGWVCDIPKHFSKSGTSLQGEGWNDALREAMNYLISRNIDVIQIFTTRRDTVMEPGYSKCFKMISWNYITANQVDHELRQKAYGAIWK